MPKNKSKEIEPQMSGKWAVAARAGAFDQPVDWSGKVPQDKDASIIAIFREYARLVDNYGDLGGVGKEIRSHVSKLRAQPKYAAVLNEPAAAELRALALKHERNEELCCAYWAYKRAAELRPAPSAVYAANRFAELDADPQVVASAEACRQLKWCHQAYQRAERLLSARPERAKEIFAEIVRVAPEESEVYLAASKQIEQ